MRVDFLLFPGGYFLVVIPETDKEPHRIKVFSADPQKRF
jgi:hypothetical protein